MRPTPDELYDQIAQQGARNLQYARKRLLATWLAVALLAMPLAIALFAARENARPTSSRPTTSPSSRRVRRPTPRPAATTSSRTCAASRASPVCPARAARTAPPGCRRRSRDPKDPKAPRDRRAHPARAALRAPQGRWERLAHSDPSDRPERAPGGRRAPLVSAGERGPAELEVRPVLQGRRVPGTTRAPPPPITSTSRSPQRRTTPNDAQAGQRPVPIGPRHRRRLRDRALGPRASSRPASSPVGNTGWNATAECCGSRPGRTGSYSCLRSASARRRLRLRALRRQRRAFRTVCG